MDSLYAQEPALGEMDTTPPDMPSFVPDLTLLPQDYQPELPVGRFDQPMQLPLPSFMSTPMDQIDPLLHRSADFTVAADPFAMITPAAELSLSLSPPQSHVPSPSAHASSPSFAAGATPTLESTLEQVAVPGGRSRTNTSLSPPSNPSTFHSLSPNSSASVPVSNATLEESVSQQKPQTMIGKMLKDIAVTAIDAGDAFENSHGAVEQATKFARLKNRIDAVVAILNEMTLDNKDAPVFPLPLQHNLSLVSGTEQVIPSLPVLIPQTEPTVDIAQLAVSDQSRKRCASELEEHRTLKALKREPQDDTPLSLSIQDAPIISTSSVPFPHPQPIGYPNVPPLLPAVPGSRPSSRPPTPPPSVFVPGNSFQQTSITAAFPAFLPAAPTPSAPPPVPLPMAASNPQPPYPLPHSSWSDPIVPTRHHHSLSAGSTKGPLSGVPSGSTHSAGAFPSTSVLAPLTQHSTVPSNGPIPVGNPVGRMSRSGSISGTNFRNPFITYPYNEPYSDPATAAWHVARASGSASRPGQSNWYFEPHKTFTFTTSSAPHTAHNSPSDGEDDDDDSDSDESTSGKTAAQHGSGDRPSTSAVSDLPAEYQGDVDRIFFEFLNKLCSNLDATDAKGEQIHQTLMAKKMQRLDESPDFRPFKFRIQAFTNAFMDELAKQGYPEAKIPMKKARNYLWHQPHILRFNEDGKKAKSKGNHIWNVEARKAGEGQWEFRPFQRKLAGTPPSVAYCGLRWSWKPHVWHPQCSFKKVPVAFSSPSLPSWLSWKNGELSGIPPPDAESCQVTAIAKFAFDSKEDQVVHTFTISIAPVSALDSASYSRSRRPSLVGEPPKRSTSDSALFQIPQKASIRMDDTRVIRVLQNVAQRVTDKAESHFVSASSPKGGGELQDLVKQKHVLEQTVDAYDRAISGQAPMDSRRLAVAAQHVVLQAAQTVIADRTVASGGVPTPQTETVAIQSVSVNELTNKTQDAIAMAVKMNGTTSNEVDIIVAATSILKSQTPVIESPTVAIPPQPRIAPPGVPASRIASAFPPSNLAPLPEYS